MNFEFKIIFCQNPEFHFHKHFFPVSVHGSETEDRLLKKLFENYNAAARPVRFDKDAVNVVFGLSMSQIVDVVSGNILDFIFIEICFILDYYEIHKFPINRFM